MYNTVHAVGIKSEQVATNMKTECQIWQLIL